MPHSGPTQTIALHPTDDRSQWAARPGLARLITVSLFVLPIAASMTFGYLAAQIAPPHRLGVNRWLWWLAVALMATLLLRVLDRVVSRITPIALLFRLSLIFPDRAPSRFKMTMRSASARSLERALDEKRSSGAQMTTDDEYATLMLQMVGALSDHDRLTRGHSERVRAYTTLIAEELNVPPDILGKLQWAALVHDMGKLDVPAEILTKPTRPDPEEWAILASHPAQGARRVAPLAGWLGEWVHAVGHHHERWDGKGYPSGLAREQIPRSARIVGVADAFDVMTSVRSYKKATPTEVARREIADGAGTQFDPVVVRAFLNISLGRLRLAAGPFAWLASATGLRPETLGGLVSGAGSAIAVAAGALGLAGGIAPPSTEPPTVAFIEGAAPAVSGVPSITVDEDRVGTLTVEFTGLSDGRVTIVGEPAAGSADVGPPVLGDHVISARLRYRPEPDFNGSDGVVLRACDAAERCVDAAIPIVIRPINDAPRVEIDPATVSEGGEITFALTGGPHPIRATDVDGDDLSISDARTDSAGEATFDATSVLYVHLGGESIDAPLQIEVTDGTEAVAVDVDLTVTPVNDPPIAVDDTLFTRTDQPATLTSAQLLANDIDVDSPSLRVTSVSPARRGTVDFRGSVAHYTPPPGYGGRDDFTYSMTDGLTVATGTVSVTIAALGVAPDARPDSITVDEGGTVSLDPRSNDLTGDIGWLALTALGSPAHGRAVDADPLVTYTHDGGETTADSFGYTVTNSSGLSDASTVSVIIAPVNDPPAFGAAATFAVPEDAVGGMSIGSVAAADPDSPTLTYSIVGGDPGGVFAISSSGHLSVSTPSQLDFEAQSTYTLTVRVTDGALVDTATVTVNVADRNEAPGDAASNLAVNEGASQTTLDLRWLHIDPDGDPLVLSLGSPATNGTVVDNGDGTITYTHDATDTVADAFGYVVTDPFGSTGNGTVNVTINPVNDPPTITGAPSPQSVTENMPAGTLVASMTGVDSDGGPPNWSIIAGDPGGVFAIDSATGDLTTTMPIDREVTASFTLTIELDDGTDAVTQALVVDINDVNEAPTIADAGFSVSEDATTATIIGSVTATDPEGGPLTYAITAGDGSGVFAIAANGDVSIADDSTLDYDNASSFTLTVRVDDDRLPSPNSDVATITVTVLSRTTLSATYGDLAPNEVLFAERPFAPDEFIEFVNVSGATIDLDGWTFADGDSVNGLVDPAPSRMQIGVTGTTLVAPDDRVVVWVGSPPPFAPANNAPGADLQLYGSYPTTRLSSVADDLWVFDQNGDLAAYLAWGDEAAVGSQINDRPPGTWSLWDRTDEVSLAGAGPGQSISLTPDRGAAIVSSCWEPTTSGAAGGRCAGAAATADTDGAFGRVSSVGATNNAVAMFAPNIVISEYSTDDAHSGGNFIEIYNGTASSVDLSTMALHIYDSNVVPVETIPITVGDTMLLPGDHYLFAQSGETLEGVADDTFATDLNPDTGIGIWDGAGYLDAVGNRIRSSGGSFGAAGLMEGTGVPPLINAIGFDLSYERFHGSGAGNCIDTDDNSADFFRNMAPGTVNPQSSASPLTPCGSPPPPPPPATHLVISQLRTDGAGGGSDEYVEIFNPTGSPIDLGDYEVRSQGGSVELDLTPFLLVPGQRYVVAGAAYSGARDAAYGGGGIGNGGAVELWNATLGVSVDYIELDTGSGIPLLPQLDGRLDHAYVRVHGGCTDTDAVIDFIYQMFSNPTTSLGAPTPCP